MLDQPQGERHRLKTSDNSEVKYNESATQNATKKTNRWSFFHSRVVRRSRDANFAVERMSQCLGVRSLTILAHNSRVGTTLTLPELVTRRATHIQLRLLANSKRRRKRSDLLGAGDPP